MSVFGLFEDSDAHLICERLDPYFWLSFVKVASTCQSPAVYPDMVSFFAMVCFLLDRAGRIRNS